MTEDRKSDNILKIKLGSTFIYKTKLYFKGNCWRLISDKVYQALSFYITFAFSTLFWFHVLLVGDHIYTHLRLPSGYQGAYSYILKYHKKQITIKLVAIKKIINNKTAECVTKTKSIKKSFPPNLPLKLLSQKSPMIFSLQDSVLKLL